MTDGISLSFIRVAAGGAAVAVTMVVLMSKLAFSSPFQLMEYAHTHSERSGIKFTRRKHQNNRIEKLHKISIFPSSSRFGLFFFANFAFLPRFDYRIGVAFIEINNKRRNQNNRT